MKSGKRRIRELMTGLGFLSPNILGFLAFTLVPLVYSLALAFSNWDLRLHNMFRDEPIQFIGLRHFVDLLTHDDFWRYLKNTLFLMMGIPVSIAGSLMAAILLSQKLDGGGRRLRLKLILTLLLLLPVCLLVLSGLGGSAMVLLMSGLGAAIFISGLAGGSTLYRTFFYTPHFTAGVATFILWKKMYNPQGGPVNQALRPVLNTLASVVNALPSFVVESLSILLIVAAGWIFMWFLRLLRRSWDDGEFGFASCIIAFFLVLLPFLFSWTWTSHPLILIGLFAIVLLHALIRWFSLYRRGPNFASSQNQGLGTALLSAAGIMVVLFGLIGFSEVFTHLPSMASDGLNPPDWLTDYHWAKPALMIMMFWASIGSNNMILYIAGLSNISQDLYEVADINGARPWQKFWYVTWPQLAPVTFFIVVMSVIHGLQGGFEMARTMTEGGPAGATTTLSYFVYIEGFETGQLGYASAVAWTLFLLVFTVTLFNWKFGNRYVND